MDKDKQPVPQDPQVAPAEGQKTQYVITQRSLNGLGGWLLFFVIVFAIAGLGEVGLFFSGLDAGAKNPSESLALVFSPLLGVGFLASVVLLAMRKKLALVAVYITLAVSALYGVMTTVVATDAKEGLGEKVGAVVVGLLMYALLALYFRQSRRVKETLVK